MTVGEAMECLETLRPGSRIPCETRQRWLREVDGMLRNRYFAQSQTEAYDEVGADRNWENGLREETVLLAPEPFDGLYPHYLCARNDAALGEINRYAGEQAQYNSILAELAVWLRQTYPPKGDAKWKW